MGVRARSSTRRPRACTVAGIVVTMALAGCIPPPARPGLPLPGGTGWKRYPYVLDGNPLLTFPDIEGRTNNGTDTWYIQGRVTGRRSGRQYAFITIFARNRIGGFVRADLYTLAIFPLDATTYGTSTDTDIAIDTPWNHGKLTAATGYLDLSWAGRASWRNHVDRANRLVPFTYDLDLHGKDAQGRPMALVGAMDAREAPAAPGPGPTPGIIRINGQSASGSYFQTGLAIHGELTYGGVTEPVVGNIGHIDRQWFPQYAGAQMGPYARDHGHDWGSVHLDDGTTLSLWAQYYRPTHNSPEAFTGATRFFPDTGSTEFAPDITVTPTSYVKWPSSIPVAFAPPAPKRYLVSGHVIDVPSWGLHLVGTPITIAPAHALPVEYMSGPVNYRGTLAGRPITGFGQAEHTEALYRKWELVDVLRVTLTNLADGAFLPGGVTRRDALAMVRKLDGAVDAADAVLANRILTSQLASAVATLAVGERPFLRGLLHDIAVAPAA